MSQTLDLIRQKFPVATGKVERTIADARTGVADVVQTGTQVADAAMADGKKLAAAAIQHGKSAIQFGSDLGQAVAADAKPAAENAVEMGKTAYDSARQVGAKLAGQAGYRLNHLAHWLKQD